ncbi:hypothetical protein [Natronobacterium texcoconense]|uniref:Uncharacterized protein n=1 Tax=Natronobacterium texcoconense TaxID=1095778 RepID=A0A1H1F857_NATTX|nr:hypothetical protein [Natronobacterium texcoconense]SDQ97131.1 hypothetical protein SAMN04489842_1862 [Natronobacterium texcoconense]
MNSRLLLLFALLVAVLLPLSLFTVPGLYLEPTNTQRYAVAHESTVAFDSTVVQTDLEASDTTPITELSPSTQQAFADAKASGDARSGWAAVEITVCHELAVVCNGYDEAPAFPEDATGNADEWPADTYGIVDDDGDRYVVETHRSGSLGFGFLVVYPLVLVSFTLYGLYLAVVALRYRNANPLKVLGSAGDGLIFLVWPSIVAAVGVADPLLFVVLPLTLLPIAAIVVSIGITILKKWV